MEYIAHRINCINDLKNLSTQFGMEVDLRDGSDHRIYMQHDPFLYGEDFEEFLSYYHHGMLVLNIKSERIEIEVLKLLKKYCVKNYFFLDSSFPMIYALTLAGECNIALRVSEFEGIDTIRNMKGKCKWVWMDCFNDVSINKKEEKLIHEMGYKICAVSPELQGRQDILSFIKKVNSENIKLDAVCTKKDNIELWKKMYEEQG